MITMINELLDAAQGGNGLAIILIFGLIIFSLVWYGRTFMSAVRSEESRIDPLSIRKVPTIISNYIEIFVTVVMLFKYVKIMNYYLGHYNISFPLKLAVIPTISCTLMLITWKLSPYIILYYTYWHLSMAMKRSI